MSTKYWKLAVEIEENSLATYVELYTCMTCGAAVLDRPQHSRWHEEVGK